MVPDQPQPPEDLMNHMAQIVQMNDKMIEGMIQLQGGMQSLTTISLSQCQNLEKLLNIATQQQDSLQQFIGILREQALAITELSRSLRESLDSSRQLARTIDASAALATANQISRKA